MVTVNTERRLKPKYGKDQKRNRYSWKDREKTKRGTRIIAVKIERRPKEKPLSL